MKIPYSYLSTQFNENVAEEIWAKHVKPVVTRGDFTLGEEVREFETKLADLIGVKHCLGVANGTDALELALWACDLPKGSDVIVPVNTFVASVAAIVTAGHNPIFVDTNDKFVIDPNKIEESLTEDTKAILPVHFSGQPCDMKAINEIAGEYGIYIVEDAAQAANAKSNVANCGASGDIAGISFHPQKNLNCWGDGGAITTNDPNMYERLLLYRNHGMLTRDDYAFASRNSRLDTLHAAVMNYFIDKLPQDNDRRIDIASRYNEAFKEFAKVPKILQSERHTFHLYMMRLMHGERDRLLKHLHYFGVDARIHYPKPLHLQPAFAFLKHKQGDFPVAEKHSKEMISLPIHQYMEDQEIDYVIETVKKFFR